MTSLLQGSPIPSTSMNQLPPAVQRIVLIGFMGAGKSTIGRLLARSLGWNFVDTDSEVEVKHACTVAEMFLADGEAVFRRRESSALARALGQAKSVIAVGGGAPEILTNRLLLEQTPGSVVVFLDAPFEVLFDRCVLQEGAAIRPVLVDPVAAAERFQQRAPFYRRCAGLHVQTGALGAEETVQHLLSALLSKTTESVKNNNAGLRGMHHKGTSKLR